ncbi:MAG: hypothetical protein ACKVI4_16255 [Actinomycetales bacterium]
MPRTDEPVVLNHDLWSAVADGVVVSADLSPSLRLRQSLSATLPLRVRNGVVGPLPRPPSHDWRAEAARLREGLPYSRQVLTTHSPSSGPPSPGTSRPRSPSGGSENVELNILRHELAQCEDAHKQDKDAAARRERALFKVVEGFCEYQSACAQR